jgi:hypothetical protein
MTTEFQGTAEQPVIDIIGVTTNTENVGFEFQNIRYRFLNFSFLKFIYKHRDITVSLPILKRNIIMLIKGRYRALIGIKTSAKEILRNTLDAVNVLESIADEYLLKYVIPKKMTNIYLITSPFISQGLTLLPFVAIYVATNDRQFYLIHLRFGCLRTLYLVKFPFRLLCSNLMPFSCQIAEQMVLFGPLWFAKMVWRTGGVKFLRRLTLSIAIVAEIFGEPFPPKRLVPNKPLTYKVAQPCDVRFLKHLQKKQQENPLMFEVMRGDNLMELVIIDDVPRIADCVIESTLRAERLNDINRLQIEEKKPLRNLRIIERKKLRMRSEIKAKTLRDAIKRVLFF